MSEHPGPDTTRESVHRFDCFGGRCTVIVADGARPADADVAGAMSRRALLGWHDRFSRFQSTSELSAFNRDPRRAVPVSPLLSRLARAALRAARDTGGLVDATLGAEIERAGYRTSLQGAGIPLDVALALAPARAAARPADADPLSRLTVDAARGTITRRPGTVFDPGGIAKGVFADELAELLDGFDAFAIDCAGDIRLGGRAGVERPIHVTSPFDGARRHSFGLRDGAIATSGIGKRSWLDGDARPAHHLLDPRTGRPAYTGVVQATALAPTAAEAETLAKAALLSGPAGARAWLRHGGLIVFDDGSYELLGAGGAPAEGVASPTAPAAAAGTLASNRSASHPRISVSTVSRSGSLRISWNRPA
jgi:thiamine biosynthesis lipoprotein